MIRSTTNAQVRKIRSLASDRRERRRERMFVIEGVRLVADALISGADLPLVLYAPEQLETTVAGQGLVAQLTQRREALVATPEVVEAACETVQPQGVVALARWPDLPLAASGLLLVLDNLQDPGNLGTLLRSAEAVGVAGVLCSKGSVDLFSPKVVRAAMGAHFRLAMEQDLGWETVADRLVLADHVYIADSNASMPYFAADWRQSSALIIGNEAHGVSPEAEALATKRIAIPMRGSAESLNAAVAGSVILFEALRQRTLGRS